MTVEEKDRLIEVVFYLYFYQKPEEILGSTDFWKVIEHTCNLYGIDSLAISKTVRLLMLKENTPQTDETYYLLHTVGASSRAINKMSGIYWQIQTRLQKEFDAGSKPIIKRRISDIVMRHSMRAFIQAVYKHAGIFSSLDIRLLEKEKIF